MQITVTRITLGTLDLTKEGKVIASDPCYEPDIWCAHEVEVRKGNYIVKAVYGNVPDWGERVIELTINHIDTPHRRQLWNYLRITRKPYGMLINFSPDGLYSEWYHFDDRTGEIDKIKLI